MITWFSPWAFLFLVPLVAAAVWRYLKKRKRTGTMILTQVDLLRELGRSLRSRISFLPEIFIYTGIALFILGLARPQESSVKTKRNVEGIDIMIALDISDSMLIEDMTPENRMVASREIIKKFVQGRSSDRIGLVVFSGEAYTRVPLTLDYPLLLENLSKVEPSRSIKMGTAIGVALANAVSRLRDSTAKSRVVIFLTDGENNSGTIDPETAIDIAKGYGIKVYSVGMGQDGQAQIPVFVKDFMGRTIKQYRPIHSTVNNDLLGRMASETGGKYYRATTSQALANVFKDINRLEKTKIELNQYVKYKEMFEVFVVAGLILFFLGFLFSNTWLRVYP